MPISHDSSKNIKIRTNNRFNINESDLSIIFPILPVLSSQDEIISQLSRNYFQDQEVFEAANRCVIIKTKYFSEAGECLRVMISYVYFFYFDAYI